MNDLTESKASSDDSDRFEIATLGGGCFWCIEALFNELDGVIKVTSGYSGGFKENPSYQEVSNGNTGHAEVVQVNFDQQKISFAGLLRIFLVTHDPTSLNSQGADVGTEYRSIILYHNETQRKVANEVIEELQSSFDQPIVTEVAPFSKFYKAAQSHQDYYRNNEDNAYCQIVINPKLQKLRKHFSSALKKKAA